jgi:hypothetical protein
MSRNHVRIQAGTAPVGKNKKAVKKDTYMDTEESRAAGSFDAGAID